MGRGIYCNYRSIGAGGNPTVMRLQLLILGYLFAVYHRPNLMLEKVDYFSQIDNPLMLNYLKTSANMYHAFPPDIVEITKVNFPIAPWHRATVSADEVAYSVNLAQVDLPIVKKSTLNHLLGLSTK